MGCKICKKSTVDESAIKTSENNVRSRQYEKNAATNDNTTEKPIIPIDLRIDNDTNTDQYTGTNDHTEIQVADPQAFNDSLIQQRQQAINNRSYQSTIKSWRPKSLQQLTETIKAFSQGKSFVDRHWIIFYWIASNIEYDTVSYFSGKHGDQTAEGVFRAKKGVCAGY
ncbi:unnamed protein product, partial [Rotaria sordida]